MVRVGLDKLERDRKATVAALQGINIGRKEVGKKFTMSAEDIF